MFSSNQKFKISGDFSQLESALRFALEYSGHAKNMTIKERERGCKLLYQISKKGAYCIGWGFQNTPDGWSEYPFDFEVGIVSGIIVQHLSKMKATDSGYEWADGGFNKGFIMKTIRETFSDEHNGIKSPFYGIVSFEPFTNFYSK